MGTGAFWEGVDVRGNDLVCVMIDKLPFASPDDPLLQARMEDVKSAEQILWRHSDPTSSNYVKAGRRTINTRPVG